MVAPVSAPRKNRRSTLLERRYAIALREDMGLSYPEISRVTGFTHNTIHRWCRPDLNAARLHRHKLRRRHPVLRERARKGVAKWRKENPDWTVVTRLRNQAQRGGYVGPTFSIDDLRVYKETHGGCCDVCGKNGSRTLHTEHDHVTGALRGLVCDGCNQVLGVLDRGDLDMFRAYLTKPPIAGGK